MTAAASGRLGAPGSGAHSEGVPVTIATADVEQALNTLAQERPAFHSEADFQRDFARTLGKLHPDIDPRTEYPVPWINPSGYRGSIDLWLRGADGTAAIELKYWKRQSTFEAGGERFDLRDWAGDLERYEFWKDVERTERLVAEGHAASGYVLALTNHQGAWNKGQGSTYDEFRLHEGRRVEGTLDWAAKTPQKTRKGRPPLALRGRYVTSWRDYSQPAHGVEFRYLLLDVGEGLRRARGDSA